jgi:hypothetical protein
MGCYINGQGDGMSERRYNCGTMSEISKQDIVYQPWPPLSYPDFAATQHLLHMGLQAVGKLKLKEPFEPQWAGITLLLSSRGLTPAPSTIPAAPMKSHLT